MENFFIDKNYRINEPEKAKTEPYCDSEENSRKYQVEVYILAKKLIRKNRLNSVLDIGCGHGAKLKEYIQAVCPDITGIDTEHSIGFCKKEYSFGKWYTDDIENPKLKNDKKYDLIISADIIEHLTNPDKLLEYIKKNSHKDTLVVLSTPERDSFYGKGNLGPPANTTHIREWNKPEFSSYLASRGFIIRKHFLAINYKNSWRTKIKSFIFPWTNEYQIVLARIK